MDKKQIVLNHLYSHILERGKRGYELDGEYIWVRVSNRSVEYNEALYELEQEGKIQIELHPDSIRVAVPYSLLVDISCEIGRKEYEKRSGVRSNGFT